MLRKLCHCKLLYIYTYINASLIAVIHTDIQYVCLTINDMSVKNFEKEQKLGYHKKHLKCD